MLGESPHISGTKDRRMDPGLPDISCDSDSLVLAAKKSFYVNETGYLFINCTCTCILVQGVRDDQVTLLCYKMLNNLFRYIDL